MQRTALVSGGSGYIAGYIIRLLVSDGWNVRTTIRNLAKEPAVRALLAVDNSKISFFAADLNSDAGWTEAMMGCSHVVHVASPFPSDTPKTDDELIIPARDGSKRVPGKNVRLLCGKPLIVWSIEVAKDIPEICDIVVSTDGAAIAEVSLSAGASVPEGLPLRRRPVLRGRMGSKCQ